MATSKVKLPSHLTDIPDHLLDEIFLRLPDPADLARASAACVPFRRLATDRSFIRRFRCLHEPPFLGFLDREGFHPVLPPHPSAPAARPLDLAAGLFSFLPSPYQWTVQDICDGRVLLYRDLVQDERPRGFTELAVCDPMRRWYVLLPPVPDDLTSSLKHPVSMVRGAFLVPLGEEEAAAGERAFRVILKAHCKTSLAAFVYSSSTGKWQAAAFKSWSDLVRDKDDSTTMSKISPFFLRRHYAYDCFYWDWLVIRSKKLLVLDIRMMEFSIAHLPPGEWSKKRIAIVEAGEGRLGMFCFRVETSSDLSYTVARNKGKSPSQWQMEKTISLDSGYKYSIRAATERYLPLTRTLASSQEDPLVEYFSMDIKTFHLQKVCEKKQYMYDTHIYTNFPPSLLSSRTI